MTRTFWTKESWRWIIAAFAVVAVFFGTLYFGLFVLVFGAFPKDLAEPTAAFLMSSLVVLAGSLFVPRYRLVTAIVLFVLSTSLSAALLNLHILGGLAGGFIAVAFVACWFHSRRTVRSTLWVGVVTCLAFFAFIALVYARHMDRPAGRDVLPSELMQALGTNASRVTAFYRYDLGGFIDHEWLWRIDANSDVVSFVISGLGLQSTNVVPQRFWRMPPHYWPKALPTNAEAFQSPAFSADNRGPDGVYYFLLHDKAHERAFVWFKSNY